MDGGVERIALDHLDITKIIKSSDSLGTDHELDPPYNFITHFHLLPVLWVVVGNMDGITLWVSLIDVHLFSHRLVHRQLHVLIVRRQTDDQRHHGQGEDDHLDDHHVMPLFPVGLSGISPEAPVRSTVCV